MKRLLILVLVASLGFTQTIGLRVNSSILNSKLNRLSINDFDFIGAGKTQSLFTGIVDIDVENNQDLRFQLFFRFSYNGKSVVNAKTNIINNVATQQLRFSNTQISDDISMRTQSGSVSLKFDRLEIDDNSGLISDARVSAKLPDGTYFMEVVGQLTNSNGAVVATKSDNRRFTLRQNWPINLSNPVGEVNTSTPLFQWDSRASKYPKVTLYIWESDGDKSSSISKAPVLKKVYNNVNNTVIPTSFAFPADNPRPLEDSKTYFWTVKVTIVTAAGPKEEDNEILEFSYKKPKSGNINNTAVKNILQQLLGNAYSTIEAEFAGYDLKSITLNGDDAQINNLATYIQKVTSGEYNLLVETY